MRRRRGEKPSGAQRHREDQACDQPFMRRGRHAVPGRRPDTAPPKAKSMAESASARVPGVIATEMPKAANLRASSSGKDERKPYPELGQLILLDLHEDTDGIERDWRLLEGISLPAVGNRPAQVRNCRVLISARQLP